MEVIRRYRDKRQNFLTHVIEHPAGDTEYFDASGDGIMPSSPLQARVSVDSEQIVRIHHKEINKVKKTKVQWNDRLRMFSKLKNSDHWGIFPDEVDENMTVEEAFEIDGNDIILPVNQRIEDLKHRIRNLEILDEEDYVDNFWMGNRFGRPTTVTYLNACKFMCATFNPMIKWHSFQNGAWFQFLDEGPKKIIRKGSNENWFLAARTTRLTDGTRIQAGVPYKWDQRGSLEVQDKTNILLHIYR